MGVTPVYGWPFQELLDPPDGASLGEDLAMAIEATVNGLDANLSAFIASATVQTYVPTLTNITLGNGTRTGIYVELDDWVWFRFKIVFGNSSSMGSGPQVSLPVAPDGTYYAFDDRIGELQCYDNLTASYVGDLLYVSGSNVQARVFGASGTYVSDVSISSTVPMTWTTSDRLTGQGMYKKA